MTELEAAYPWEDDLPMESTTHPKHTIKEFGEEINTNETEKEKIKRYYNEFAWKEWYVDIADFYVKKKMDLLIKWTLSSSDEKVIKLLSTISTDLWYGWQSKEFIMENGLNKSTKSVLWK